MVRNLGTGDGRRVSPVMQLGKVFEAPINVKTYGLTKGNFYWAVDAGLHAAVS